MGGGGKLGDLCFISAAVPGVFGLPLALSVLSGLLEGMHVSSLAVAVAVVVVVGASGCCGTVSGMTRVGVADGLGPLGMAFWGVLIT